MMRRNSKWFGIVTLLIITGAVAYTGLRMSRSSAQQVCGICSRPIHHQSGAVALIGEHRETFCCLSCAFSTQRQTESPVEVVELTDYETDSPLIPEGVYLAVGTDVNLCTRHRPLLDETKQSYPVGFDRCSPSILAFARRESAKRFIQEHGGELMRFADVAASYRQ